MGICSLAPLFGSSARIRRSKNSFARISPVRTYSCASHGALHSTFTFWRIGTLKRRRSWSHESSLAICCFQCVAFGARWLSLGEAAKRLSDATAQLKKSKSLDSVLAVFNAAFSAHCHPLEGELGETETRWTHFFTGKRPACIPASFRPEYPRIARERIHYDSAFELSATSSRPARHLL